jgi:hypothetical protein
MMTGPTKELHDRSKKKEKNGQTFTEGDDASHSRAVIAMNVLGTSRILLRLARSGDYTQEREVTM